MRYLLLLVMVLGATIGQGQKNKQAAVETDTQKEKRYEIETLLAESMKFFGMEEYVRADTMLRKALKLNPEIAALNYQLAQTLLKIEKIDEAAIYAQKAFDVTPSNKFYTLLLAEVWTQQHKYDKAADLYKTLIRQDIDNAEYGFDLASVYILDEKYEEALKAYNEVERSVGIEEELINQKQRLYIKLNQLDKAIAEAKKMIDSDPNESRYLLQLAKLHLMNKQTTEAEITLQNALKTNPDDGDARVMLAEIYRQKGDNQGAAQQMNQLFESKNTELDAKMHALKQLMTEAKDATTREEVLQRAAEIVKAHPKDYRAYIVYGDLLHRADRKADARTAYLKAIKIDQSVSQLWQAILELDSQLNQADSLIAHSEQALETFPNDGSFWFWNGTGYLLKRNYNKAVEGLEEAKKLTSENKEVSKMISAQLGDAYHGIDEHEKSDDAYETVLKTDPDNTHVLNNYSYFLSLRKQKLDKAKLMAARVAELNPTVATYLDTYAWVLYVQKDYKNAREYLEKAIATGQKVSATIVEHYGDTLYQLNEKDKAVEQWQKAKTMGGKGDQLDKKISTKQLIE
jgi:tetratricopeptide (TPR) repeat protein